jgi:superfamily I DNA/RNA helicase
VELEDVYETERRLFYVACTRRSRDRLLVTGIAPGSEFLADLCAAAYAAYVAVEAVRGSDKVLIILS